MVLVVHKPEKDKFKNGKFAGISEAAWDRMDNRALPVVFPEPSSVGYCVWGIGQIYEIPFEYLEETSD